MQKSRFSRFAKSARLISKAKLDRLFSLFIRLRGIRDQYGYVKCFTCPTVLPWTAIENGHFKGRDATSTRWHEENCNPQCPQCNRFLKGNLTEYAKQLDITYGEGTSVRLTILSKSSLHMTEWEINSLAEHYLEQVKALALEKSVVVDLSFMD